MSNSVVTTSKKPTTKKVAALQITKRSNTTKPPTSKAATKVTTKKTTPQKAAAPVPKPKVATATAVNPKATSIKKAPPATKTTTKKTTTKKAVATTALAAEKETETKAPTAKVVEKKPATAKKPTAKKATAKKPTAKKPTAVAKRPATTTAKPPATKKPATTTTKPVVATPKKRKQAEDIIPRLVSPTPSIEPVPEELKTPPKASPTKKAKPTTAKRIKMVSAKKVCSSNFKPVWPEAASRKQGILLSFGSGDMSQLGLGATEGMRERKFPTVLKTLNQVVAVSTGSLHNAALTSSGLVYTWGCNDDAALGRDGDEWLPNPVDLVAVVKVCCGSSHTLALTNEGLVYSWGTYRNGQGVMGVIGPGEEKKDGEDKDSEAKVSRPTLVEDLRDVIDIACGDSISVALTRTGEVFQWGDIGNGQRISSRLNNSRLTPHRVLFKSSRITRVYAGGYSIFAVDEHGGAWGWGPNNYNQIGIESDPDTLWVRLPRRLESLAQDAVVDLAAALHHTICVTASGGVYTFGRGTSGRLGHGDENDRKLPTPVAALSGKEDRVIGVACGEAHTCCVTAKGELFTFGNGDLNQLGNGEEIDVLTPHHVQGQQLVVAKRQVLAAACGSQHTVILTTVGDASAIQKTPAAAKATISSSQDTDLKSATTELKFDNTSSDTSASTSIFAPTASIFAPTTASIFAPTTASIFVPTTVAPTPASIFAPTTVEFNVSPAAVGFDSGSTLNGFAFTPTVDVPAPKEAPQPFVGTPMDEDEAIPEPDEADLRAIAQ